ncbi:TPA: ribonuclease HI [Candidatus Nomurabacteria bacterium]|nr:ribonuclease HI [Candidatus Nomurabacteria bacterium]
MKITIYTDGSSRGNPGPGGWACVLITEYTKQEVGSKEQEGYDTEDEVIELGGREDMTTNNRMELSGALHGLREVSSKEYVVSSNADTNSLPTTHYPLVTSVEVCTDSQYVKKGMTEWIDGWIKRGWKGSTKKPVLNQDLWEALKKEEDRLKNSGVKVMWKYVPGHSGVPLNERADVIATMCADLPRRKAGDVNDLQLYRGPKRDYAI